MAIVDQLTPALDLRYGCCGPTYSSSRFDICVAQLTLALDLTCGYCCSKSNYSSSRFDICVAQLTLALDLTYVWLNLL
ncbi:hypothetical protein RRG08_019344 [Elysia crispata]|uniref:Uncharacterized protein n=1 Tax=Elysia crispata TaxID=231223 RepID=A0AAE1EB53_9GAST|nr:hypothetical protein RRG08_019344 [Elysia crispata]